MVAAHEGNAVTAMTGADIARPLGLGFGLGGRLLVALGAVQVLFSCAKNLFVAVRTVCHELQLSCGERNRARFGPARQSPKYR